MRLPPRDRRDTRSAGHVIVPVLGGPLLAEIGPDMSRFPTPGQLAAGTSSPDDPALRGYWAAQRRKAPPPPLAGLGRATYDEHRLGPSS